jgi:hypothetical protein
VFEGKRNQKVKIILQGKHEKLVEPVLVRFRIIPIVQHVGIPSIVIVNCTDIDRAEAVVHIADRTPVICDSCIIKESVIQAGIIDTELDGGVASHGGALMVIAEKQQFGPCKRHIETELRIGE